ncbi:MAG TPA: EVE domain-containing protein [Chitinophagales bacterium]|nr:EVE domain-containing protein [Chitinophagales bacterium]
MNYWLVKSDPEEYGWNELVRDKSTAWTGVRNFIARNNLKMMKNGDQVLFYHSQTDKAVVGIAKVVKEHYPDPTAAKGEPWVAVDLAPLKALPKPVTLQQIKADKRLSDIHLVRQARLSVMPLKKQEFDIILSLA